MGYKSIIQILLILAIISTICISIMKPKMHKPVIVYNSQFSVENNTSSKIEEQNIPVLVQNSNISQDNNSPAINQNEMNVAPTQTVAQNSNNISFTDNMPAKSQKINFFNPNTSTFNVKNNDTGFKTTNIKTTGNKIAQTKTRTNNVKTKNNGAKIDLNKIIQHNQNVYNEPDDIDDNRVYNPQPQTRKSSSTSASAPVKTPTAKTQTTKPSIRLAGNTSSSAPRQTAATTAHPVTLTAQEEEIAWNRWRSNLNNQIMRDAKLPTMPNGIIFKYKFTVDKYGKVSNVQTSSLTPGYTPYAIQFIAPVIRSYQGHSILNFPTGSKRVTTVVSGAWKISNTSKYSSPDDYHDIEKVR